MSHLADDSPETVARSFLAALDEGRWHDAAALVDPETRERFRSFWLTQLEGQAATDVEPEPSDTRFASAAELLGVPDAGSAARLTPADMLARVAKASHPGNFIVPGRDGEIWITRTFVDWAPLEPDRAAVRYRTEWLVGEALDATITDIHSMELIRTSTGWSVRDADLSGLGGGHILPPGAV